MSQDNNLHPIEMAANLRKTFEILTKFAGKEKETKYLHHARIRMDEACQHFINHYERLTGKRVEDILAEHRRSLMKVVGSPAVNMDAYLVKSEDEKPFNDNPLM